MNNPIDRDFVLVGSETAGGTFYVSKAAGERSVWVAYDILPGGELANPRVVFGEGQPVSWRGLPTAA